MKILKAKSREERMELKIYKKAKAEYNRKLDFKTLEIKSDALQEVADVRSELKRVRADHKEEIKQIQTEASMKSKRLDKELKKYQDLNDEISEQLMKINNIGGVLENTLQKILNERFQEKKKTADLMDDLQTVQNLVHDAQRIRKIK